MKTPWKKLLVLLLISALALGLRAEPINSSASATNPTTLNAPAAPMPLPPAPPAAPSDSDNVPVSIGPNGIHIGGPSPVDINMPNFAPTSSKQMFLYGFALPVIIVGIVFFSFAFVVGMFLYMRHRRQRMLHETLRSMIEKGVPIPPELLSSGDRNVAPRTRSDLRIGLMMIGTGVGLLIFIRDVNGGPKNVGWIPVLIGVAFLITWFIEKMNKDKNGGSTIK
jgi:hypothetical protein